MANILTLTPSQLPFAPDVVWASPPCTHFSVAAIGRNWHAETNAPKTAGAEEAMRIVRATTDLIKQLQPRYYFIENPVGKLRTLRLIESELPDAVRHTVTYCQYGDTRRKPTDIWTNAPWVPRPSCKNGQPCHVSAPRGSRTPGSTQGIKGARDRGVIPPDFCTEIAILCEKLL